MAASAVVPKKICALFVPHPRQTVVCVHLRLQILWMYEVMGWAPARRLMDRLDTLLSINIDRPRSSIHEIYAAD